MKPYPSHTWMEFHNQFLIRPYYKQWKPLPYTYTCTECYNEVHVHVYSSAETQSTTTICGIKNVINTLTVLTSIYSENVHSQNNTYPRVHVHCTCTCYLSTCICHLQCIVTSYLSQCAFQWAQEVIIRECGWLVVNIIYIEPHALHLLKYIVQWNSFSEFGIQRVLDVLSTSNLYVNVWTQLINYSYMRYLL